MIPTTTLVIGDWASWCGACGGKADWEDTSHRTVLGQRPEPYAMPGCDAVWTHVAATVDANIRAADRIRQMRPDLVYLPELVDPNELPFSAGASVSAEATGSVTGRPGNSELGANAGKPRTPATEETPPGPAGAPPGPTPTSGPADSDLVWMSTRRRGIDAHRPDGPDHTACGRPMRPYGEQLPAGEARAAYSALLCDRCWPGLFRPYADRVARRSL